LFDRRHLDAIIRSFRAASEGSTNFPIKFNLHLGFLIIIF
jgi:hypothetical protein